MSCHTFKDAIVEMARGVDVGAATSAAIESHVEHCASCRMQLTREQRLSDGLRALAAGTVTPASSEIVERRLLEAFAQQQAGTASPVTWATSRWLQAAAAVLLALGTLAWWSISGSKRSGETDGRVTGQSHAQVPSLPPSGGRSVDRPPIPGAVAPASGHAAAPSSGGAPGRPPGGRRPAQPSAPTSVIRPEGFLALPAALGLPEFESGEIVRMEIPLTSLPTYGIEIPQDAQGEPVEADLLVGQDGRARAIRLVRSTDAGNGAGRF